ncbi:MAG: DUF4399 domain-containing protein [Candidatus Rariloculaceae bacterium]
MRTRVFLTLTSCLALFGCGQDGGEPAAEMPTAAPAPAPAPAAPPAIQRKPSPDGAIVYIISPEDGDVVQSPVTVVFGLAGLGVAPAGIDLPNTGHHHLLVDTELANMGLPIPADAQNIHFGLGQTEATVELEAGEHVLRLALGDMLHVPHDPPLISEAVTIQVVQ